MRKKITLPAIAAGLIATTLLITACQPPAGARPPGAAANTVAATAQKVQVTTGTVENRIVATGKVVANASASVAFSRSGTVKEVLVKEGSSLPQARSAVAARRSRRRT